MTQKPNRDTLLMWMSAHLDGELGEDEQELLFQEMESDPDLLSEFEQIAAFASAPAHLQAFAPPATTTGFGPDDQVDFADALTDSVMAAVAPEAVSDSANGAAQLASLYVDGELSSSENILSTMERSPAAASAVFGLAATTEAVTTTLEQAHATPFHQEAAAPIAEQVEQSIADDERAGILTSAAYDGALKRAEREELDELLARDAGSLGEGFIWASEAAGVALRAACEDPMAAKAGAAALQAIAAAASREADASDPGERAATPAPGLLERLRTWLAPAVPMATAAAAVVAFLALKGPEETFKTNPGVSDDQLAQLIPETDPDDALASLDTLDEVLKNNHAEVQAIDSGAAVAAVFETEAHGITVIWVPEPEESDT